MSSVSYAILKRNGNLVGAIIASIFPEKDPNVKRLEEGSAILVKKCLKNA